MIRELFPGDNELYEKVLSIKNSVIRSDNLTNQNSKIETGNNIVNTNTYVNQSRLGKNI
jgi:hypothetical protein